MIEKPFISLMSESFEKNWDLPAFSDYNGETVSYREAGEYIYLLHQLYRYHDIKKGDKVALIGKNSKNWAVIFMSVITYGGVVVPLLPDFRPQDLLNLIDHSDSVLLFAAESIYKTMDISGLKKLRGVYFVENYLPGVESGIGGHKHFIRSKEEVIPEKFNFRDLDFYISNNNQLALISYTSGTTGFSKGVMLPHNSLMANVLFAQRNMPLKSQDKIVSFLPLAHSYGMAFEYLFPVTLGCHIIFLTKTPSPQIITEAFQKIRPRLILSVPLVIEKIYKKRILPKISVNPVKTMLKVPLLSNIVYNKIRKQLFESFGGNFHEIVIGGAPFNPDAEDLFKRIKIPFSIGYGMTECGPLISYASWDTTKLRSAGKIVDTLEIRIDSEDPYNIEGEIQVKGENVMLGYYKNETATKEVLDPDGWLHTGDLGIIDRENFVFVRGRSKSMLLGSSGQNIYPEEIEAKINNLPFVIESLVVQEGEKLVALIVPDEEWMKANQVTEEKLQEFLLRQRQILNKELPSYATISEFRIQKETFEKTPKQSIKRFKYQ
jgi:long-chain acyl-CoA synthetase